MNGWQPATPAEEVLERLEAAGVTVEFQLVPAADRAVPPELIAEAKAARLGLMRLVALGQPDEPPPPFPSGSLPPLWAVVDSTGKPTWNGDMPPEGAAERLLVALRTAWPAEVVRPLAARWAARVAEAGDRPGYWRLFNDAMAVTRDDLTRQRWTPPGAAAVEAANRPRPEAAALLPGF